MNDEIVVMNSKNHEDEDVLNCIATMSFRCVTHFGVQNFIVHCVNGSNILEVLKTSEI